MILTHPSRIRAAGDILGASPGFRIDPSLLSGQAPVSAIYATSAPSSSGSLLSSLKDKWDALSTGGKVAVAGGGAVVAVLLLGALGKGKRRR